MVIGDRNRWSVERREMKIRTKDRVLSMLRKKDGEFLSGEELALELGITRNAVWKAITALRREGCRIDAVTNRGYCFREDGERLKLQEIAGYLPKDADRRKIQIFGELDSTSRLAKELAVGGAPHGTVIIADSQTAGNAHHSNSFYSPPGGIYLSLILRPAEYPLGEPKYMIACAATAAAEIIEEKTGRRPVISGVNDLLLDGKKVCGILTESVSDFESGEIQWIVLGIGMNYRLSRKDMPSALADVAGALYPDDAGAGNEGGTKAEIGNGAEIGIIADAKEEIDAAAEAKVTNQPVKIASRNEIIGCLLYLLLYGMPGRKPEKIMEAYESYRAEESK